MVDTKTKKKLLRFYYYYYYYGENNGSIELVDNGFMTINQRTILSSYGKLEDGIKPKQRARRTK
jgi:hypothetical protein